jgi:hypothetical protein
MLALDEIMQSRDEHCWVHDGHVQLGVEQVTIDRHQIVRRRLSASATR